MRGSTAGNTASSAAAAPADRQPEAPPTDLPAPTLAPAPFRIPANPTERDLLAKYFRAFGDPTRLHILALLQEHGELSVGEIAAHVQTSQPRTSAHLACLRWCGFVATRRESRTVRYRIADARTGTVLALAQEMLADNAQHVAACRIIGGC
jgi:DNA-binding transcriptional ArsR family regulator